MNETHIFTDGSSRGNPGPGGWAAIISLSSGNGSQVVEIGGNEKVTTNNRMELTAVIVALEYLVKNFSSNAPIIIHTDSSYVLNSATKWITGWQKNNWKTKLKDDVLNTDLWNRFLIVGNGLKISWKLLKGHSGIPANERCDVIATTFADGKQPDLYEGPLDNYTVDLKVQSVSKLKSKKQKIKSSKAKAYSYVSMVRGVVKIHSTWAECEKRVKGVRGTKFKKSFSEEDERNIIASWKKQSHS